MKNITSVKYLFLLILTLSMASCVTINEQHKGKRIPPGQAKKMTGSKSAKPYAPGQQKRKH